MGFPKLFESCGVFRSPPPPPSSCKGSAPSCVPNKVVVSRGLARFKRFVLRADVGALPRWRRGSLSFFRPLPFCKSCINVTSPVVPQRQSFKDRRTAGKVTFTQLKGRALRARGRSRRGSRRGATSSAGADDRGLSLRGWQRQRRVCCGFTARRRR
jgi:hypothetical protein